MHSTARLPPHTAYDAELVAKTHCRTSSHQLGVPAVTGDQRRALTLARANAPMLVHTEI